MARKLERVTVHDDSQVNQAQRNVNSNNNSSTSENSSNPAPERNVTRHAAERVVPVYVQPKSEHMKIRITQVNFFRIVTTSVSDQIVDIYFPESIKSLWSAVYEEESDCLDVLNQEVKGSSFTFLCVIY